jgi:hypothetical protein
MSEEKSTQSSDSAIADLAKKLGDSKPMQSGKFTEAIAKAAEAVLKGEQPAPSGLTFEAALVAIKAGKAAYRSIWTSKVDGSVMLKVVASPTENGITGMSFQRGDGTTSRAGLHNDDILANDWVIL